MSSSTVRNYSQSDFRLNGVGYSLHMANCLVWMDQRAANSIHAIVTDPPYGLKEYTAMEKMNCAREKAACGEYHRHLTGVYVARCRDSPF